MNSQIKDSMPMPKIAIIDSNTLASIGMRNLINSIMPSVQVESYNTFKELEANHPQQYFHYFVATNILLEHYEFFAENRRKTIVMTTSKEPSTHLDKFHCLCISVSEKMLVKALLSLEQGAHAHGKSIPHGAMSGVRGKMNENSELPSVKNQQKVLSDREVEVLTLIVKGYINKEIADALNLSLPTIITHRKNITEKLNRKSVASLTIYAVMHGYVSVDEI